MWMVLLPTLVALFAVMLSAPLVITGLRRWRIVDVASARSSHTGVAIRGVGLAVLVGVVFGLLVGIFSQERSGSGILWTIVITSTCAAILGAIEDFRGLSILLRAGIQVIIATIASVSLVALTPISWVWCVPALVFIAGYINVANFMDGVDGISGIHGLLCGVFYLSLGLLIDLNWLAVAGSVIAASFFAFLPWNLGRQGTFLGDTGSYMLGAVIATTAVATWWSGVHLVVALAPTVIYCADTGGTLIRRILKGERWYTPHRSHVYQQLKDAGLSHLAASVVVGAFTAVVAGLSLLLGPQSGWNNQLVYLIIVGVCIIYWLVPPVVRKTTFGISSFSRTRADF